MTSALHNFKTEDLIRELVTRYEAAPAPMSVKFLTGTYRQVTLPIGDSEVATLYVAKEGLEALEVPFEGEKE